MSYETGQLANQMAKEEAEARRVAAALVKVAEKQEGKGK